MKQNSDRTRLGAALKALRLQKGWTLAEVSRRLAELDKAAGNATSTQ